MQETRKYGETTIMATETETTTQEEQEPIT